MLKIRKNELCDALNVVGAWAWEGQRNIPQNLDGFLNFLS